MSCASLLCASRASRAAHTSLHVRVPQRQAIQSVHFFVQSILEPIPMRGQIVCRNRVSQIERYGVQYFGAHRVNITLFDGVRCAVCTGLFNLRQQIGHRRTADKQQIVTRIVAICLPAARTCRLTHGIKSCRSNSEKFAIHPVFAMEAYNLVRLSGLSSIVS